LLDQNLILFGDPRSNSAIGSLLSRLPIQWSDRELSVAGTVYASDRFMPLLIFPNPIYPSRYIVLNSGFTFREYAYLNNARQVPMLPDWAVVDVSSGVTSQLPGRIVDAGFFNEQWQFD
jgi:hypothetical protein